jgi:hypothetical protein
LAAVAQNGSALRHASEALRSDREVVLTAVAQNGSALRYASEALQSDREVVLAAVAQNGSALVCASEALQSDREVVLAAVAQNGSALRCASEALQSDQLLQKLQKLRGVNPAAFLALEPLKNKLKQETNSERKEAASTMIGAMEDAIVEYYKDKDTNKFNQDVAQAISTALPVLEQQTGWKKVIDAVVNAVMNFICPKTAEQSQGKSTYRSYFFANPNTAAKELDDVEKNISSKL